MDNFYLFVTCRSTIDKLRIELDENENILEDYVSRI